VDCGRLDGLAIEMSLSCPIADILSFAETDTGDVHITRTEVLTTVPFVLWGAVVCKDYRFVLREIAANSYNKLSAVPVHGDAFVIHSGSGYRALERWVEVSSRYWVREVQRRIV